MGVALKRSSRTVETEVSGEVSEPQQTEPLAEAAGRQFVTVREQLAARRQALGMSMSALARTIGVSPSMISQIERGQALPSVETLFALATALGATVDTFFAPGHPDEPSMPDAPLRPTAIDQPVASSQRFVVRKGARAAIDVQGGIRWERLTPQALENIDFLELIYEPGAKSNEHLYLHPGLELVLVLEGRFDIYIGFERYELGPGDSIAFPSSLPHRYVNPLEQQSRAVSTILHEPASANQHLRRAVSDWPEGHS